MSFNARFVYEGHSLEYTPSSDVAAGAIVIQGNLVGIAKLDIPANTLGAISVDGVYDVVKDASAVSAGAKVYWNATSSFATITASGNTQIGVAVKAVTTDGAVVRVALNK